MKASCQVILKPGTGCGLVGSASTHVRCWLRGYEALCFRSQHHQVRFLAESGRGLPQSTTLPRLTEAVWTTGAVGGTVRRGRVSGLQP